MSEFNNCCPACKKDVEKVRVQYECANGHTWGEEVDRAVTSGVKAPSGPGMRMPFGKHKGELLDNVPTDYIVWALGNMDNLREPLKEEMDNQLAMREGKGVVRQEVKREGTKFTFK